MPRLYTCIALLVALAARADPVVQTWDGAALAWTGAPAPGVVSVERAAHPGGPWIGVTNVFALQGAGTGAVGAVSNASLFRLWAAPLPPTRAGFTNLTAAYGLLETLAGTGLGQTDGVSYWDPGSEGGPAAAAALSRPHWVMADRAGNLYIADKNSHAVLRVDTNGLIWTHAGTHAGGLNGEGPAAATNLMLNFPNSLWVRGDGTVYVLDTDNGRVRRVDTNGVMQTIFLAKSDGSALGGGRGLWVRDDEALAYFCNKDRVRCWTATGSLQTVASGFGELGNLYVETNGTILACDRGSNLVYRLAVTNSSKTVLAGNGLTTGGGDGEAGLATGLYGVRGVWPMPTGGYLLLTHDGSQLWYLDSGGTIHLLLNGGAAHAGDGEWFYSPDQRMDEGRSVCLDYAGNILICESDWGYIRRIRFLRLPAP